MDTKTCCCGCCCCSLSFSFYPKGREKKIAVLAVARTVSFIYYTNNLSITLSVYNKYISDKVVLPPVHLWPIVSIFFRWMKYPEVV